MITSQKGFISIIVLLFIISFIPTTINNQTNNYYDFIIIKQVETLKENNYLNFEKTILNSLNNCEDDPLKVNIKINQDIYNYIKLSDTNFFIKNNITNNYQSINKSNLAEIIKVIIYKPSKHIIVKELYITNGLLKNKLLGFTINSNKYYSIFLFPKNYKIKKVIFC